MIILILMAMFIGTFVFHSLENWSWVDSFYFTSVTMLTIGSNNLVPTTAVSKIFTVFFAFSTIGIVLYTITTIARQRSSLTKQIKGLISYEMKKIHKTDVKEKKSKKKNSKKKTKWLLFN